MHSCNCTPSASQVALAVQLEDSTRKQGTFPSTSPLWSVLSELGIATGSDEAKEPVIVFMRREVGVVRIVFLKWCSLKLEYDH